MRLMPNQERSGPTYDEDKVDEVALAMLWLTAFQEKKDLPWRAWKGMAWEVIDRLEARGWVYNSRTAKSLVFTDEGLKQCRDLFKKHFGIPKRASLPPEANRESLADNGTEDVKPRT